VNYENLEHEFKIVENVFPYLLVNIGSGVSILKVQNLNYYYEIR